MAEQLITSSMLIAVVALIRRLLRGRIAPALQYGLWLLVLLRLLVPASLFRSPVGVAQAAKPVTARVETVMEVSRFIPGQAPLAPAPQDAAALAASPAARENSFGLSLAAVARFLWLTGCAVMAAWFLYVNARLHRSLRRTRTLHGRREGIPVYVARGIPSPCLYGVLRPAIYLTEQAAADPRTEKAAVTHELAHCRQRDNIWAFLRVLCLVVYWFDPFVWLAAALSRRDCELSCDARTVKALGEDQRFSYGRVLLDMTTARTRPNDLLCGATTMTASGRALKERIAMIAKKPRTSVLCAAVALAMAAVAVGCTVSGSAEETPAAAPSQDFTAVSEPAAVTPELADEADHYKALDGLLESFYAPASARIYAPEDYTPQTTSVSLYDLVHVSGIVGISYTQDLPANAPDRTIILTDADGRALWVQSDIDELYIFDGDEVEAAVFLGFSGETMIDLLLGWARDIADGTYDGQISIADTNAPWFIQIYHRYYDTTRPIYGGLDLDRGDTVPLNAIVYPIGEDIPAVRWSSSDEAVAFVTEDGVLVAAGMLGTRCVITAEAQGLSASFTVFVNDVYPIPAEPEDIDLSEPAETPQPPQTTEPPRSSQPETPAQPAETTPPDILENMLAGGYTPTDDPGIFIDPNGMPVAVCYGEAMPPEG